MNSRIASILVTCGFAAPAAAQFCPSDLNSNGEVNGEDLGILLSAWGPCTAGTPTCTGDISQDGAVDGVDLGLLLAAWGSCPVVTPGWATLIEARPDPAVVTDPALRQRIIATGYAWRIKDTGTQIEMLLVPPGTFQMGCIMGSDEFGCFHWELPVRDVTLTMPFYLGRYEVTQAQWQMRTGLNPSEFQSPSELVPPDQVPNRPVDSVSWDDAATFLVGTGMRLPTEAEWEYACRAGTQTPFYNGSSSDRSARYIAWSAGQNSFGQTHPVGGLAANALGFHDMLGNAWEWVNDRFGSYWIADQVDPVGPMVGTNRIVRGGSWANITDCVRSSFRSGINPDVRNGTSGFRVARNP
jgi:formylglycine-generating enzyme required for sulfatase activity